MRITRRVREEAAVLASAGACAGEHQCFVFEAFKTPRFTQALSLLYSAYQAVRVDDHDGEVERRRQEWAEAEAMLRTGWTP
jgi:hypothetical protein